MNTESQNKITTTDPNLIGVIEPNKGNFIHTYSEVSLQGASLEYGTKVSKLNARQEFYFNNPMGKNTVVMANRTKRNGAWILPVSKANNMGFDITRSDIFSQNASETFHYLAIGSNSSTGVADVVAIGKSEDGKTFEKKLATFQWGTANSTTSKVENFKFNQPYKKSGMIVITNSVLPDATRTLPVVDIDAEGFDIRRSDHIHTKEPFSWIAIGDCELDQLDYFSFPLGNGYSLQGGQFDSSQSDHQFFSFNERFGTACETVVTNRCSAESEYILPVSGIGTGGFSINRSPDISGNQPFYWVAIGK